MELKANYYRKGSGGGLGNPSDPFQRFFTQLSPQRATKRSQTLSVEVLPLPVNGKPSSFSGGVGDFTIASAIDRYEVRANEPIRLTVKVEGRGNVTAIEPPPIEWPDDLELYEVKTNANVGKSGVGEKVFDFLLIPRAAGKVTIPTIQFSFFDPKKKQYVTKSTDSVALNVLTGVGSGVAQRPSAGGAQKGSNSSPSPSQGLQAALMNPADFSAFGGDAGFGGYPWWRWFYWLSAAAFLLFFGWVARDQIARRFQPAKAVTNGSATLSELSQRYSKSRKADWAEIVKGYQDLATLVLEEIDRNYSVGAKSFSRTELREKLVEKDGEQEKMDAHVWSRVEKLLEYSEMVQYAGSAGAVNQEEARQKLSTWIDEAGKLTKMLAKSG